MRVSQRGRMARWVVGGALLGGLIAGACELSVHNYLLFHSLVELLSVAVAFVMFAIAWHTRTFSTNHFLLFLGIGYAFIGSVDLLHTLAYAGMGVFRGSPGANLATQLWIGSRSLEAATLVVAPVFLTRKLQLAPAVLSYLAATTLLLLSVLLWRVFPDCYVEGVGLTAFKKASEYAISAVLVGAAAFLIVRRRRVGPSTYRYLIGSIGLTICAELVFTGYVSVHGAANLAGHVIKAASFGLIYMAIVRFTLTQPYEALFADLNRSQERLEHLLRHDPLTGALNRFGLDELLVRETARARRHGYPLAFVMVDVDRLKEINDRYGHQVGDRVLRSVATILRAATRAEDYVFRYGGDEFLVVLPEVDGDSTYVVERIRRAIEGQDAGELGVDSPLSVSIGVERLLPSEQHGIDSTLDKADRRMYEDKRRHRE